MPPRREAEIEALTRPAGEEGPVVVAINPSFTMGPEDFDGKVPANFAAPTMKSI